jgi:predicted nucleotidyltransferase
MILLTKNIIATLAYYDVMEYPLTAFEVWKHFLAVENEVPREEVTLPAIVEALSMLVREGRVKEDRGFYFLPDRTGLVDRRLSEGKVSIARLRRLRHLVVWLRFLPFVRMIGVTGSLAMEKGEAESDWDLLVVLRRNFIFTGRAVITLFLHLIGKRRHGEKTRNRACLNYFITDESLEIGTKDVYSAHEYRFLIPLSGWSVYRKFEMSNRWIVRFQPQFFLTEKPSLLLVRESAFASLCRSVSEHILSWGWMERVLRTWQQQKIAANPLSSLPQSYIEATDRALIFLPKPRGPKIFTSFRNRFASLRLS